MFFRPSLIDRNNGTKSQSYTSEVRMECKQLGEDVNVLTCLIEFQSIRDCYRAKLLLEGNPKCS